MAAIISASAPLSEVLNRSQLPWKTPLGRDHCLSNVYAYRKVYENIRGRVVKYRPLKGLSRMMGNYHVRFLGGEGSW